MIIAIPRERKTLEKRVALTPDGAAELIKDGNKVIIEKEKYGIKNQMLHAYELAIPKAISSNMNIDNAADKDNAYINDTGEMCIRTNVPDGFIKVLKGENLWQHGTQEDLEALH